MAERGGQQRELVFCHNCESDWLREEHGLECPNCHSDIVEIIEERHDPRDHNTTVSSDETDHARTTPDVGDDSLPRHPLHHHNPWHTESPDPHEPDIEHVEWNPAPGVHISYRSNMTGRPPQGHADAFPPIFQSLSTMFGSAANTSGRPPGSPRVQHSNHIHRPEFASQNPFPDHHHVHHHHGPWMPGTPLGGRTVFTATGRWLPSGGPGPSPGSRDGSNIHAVLATLLHTMQTGMMEQGHGPQNGMPNMQAFLSAILGGAHGDAVYTDEALDRIITQMMEQQNANGAPGPASAAAIAALPKQKVDKSMMGQDGRAECSVCMDAVEIGDEVTTLPCKHWFHGDCVGAWLKEHDTCPHCRQGIMPKDAPATADTPRSPDQEPRNNQNAFPFHGSGSPNQPNPPFPMPGAFIQPGMQQPYVPGGFQQYPEPQNYVSPSGQEQGHVSNSPSPQPPSPQQQPPQNQHYHSTHRRRSSARDRSSGNSGEGSSSSSGGQGVTGWFRRLGGSSSSSGGGGDR